MHKALHPCAALLDTRHAQPRRGLSYVYPLAREPCQPGAWRRPAVACIYLYAPCSPPQTLQLRHAVMVCSFSVSAKCDYLMCWPVPK